MSLQEPALKKIFLLIFLPFFLFHCGGEEGKISPQKLVTTAYPPGGTYPIKNLPRITLKTNQPGVIYFTLDGTVPDRGKCNNRTGPTFCYESPVTGIEILYNGMTVLFFGEGRNGEREGIKKEQYFIDGPPKSEVEPPCGGLYNRSLNVRIRTDEPATVYYTTDGSDPEPGNPSTVTAPTPATIVVDQTTEIRFKTVDSIGNEETIRSCRFTIDRIPPKSTATPKGGSFSGPVNVTLTITNDSGLIYYTTNGAIPRENDPQGHTQIASLSTTLTLRESTFLRFTSVDKAGNLEHSPGQFNQEIYTIGGSLPVIATPPGGEYTETSLSVTLTTYPLDATIVYSLNGSPFSPYTGPILLTTREVELRFQAFRGIQSSPLKTEFYRLGVGSEVTTFTEEFTTTSRIDLSRTNAVINTAQGTVTLPKIPLQVIEEKQYTDSAQQVAFQNLFSHDQTNSASPEETLLLIEGSSNPFAPPTTNNGGVKIFTFPRTETNPTLTLQGTIQNSTSNPQFFGVELLCSREGVPLAIVAPTTTLLPPSSSRLDLYNITDTTNPTKVGEINIQSSSGQRTVLKRRKNCSDPDGQLFVQDRSSSQLRLYGISLTSSLSATLYSSVPANFIDFLPDPTQPTSSFYGVGTNCIVEKVTVSDTPTTTVTKGGSLTICGNTTSPLLFTFLFGGVPYGGVVYTSQSVGNIQVNLFRLDQFPSSSTIPNLLMNPPQGTPLGVGVLFGSTTQPVLVISDGNTLFFYDLGKISTPPIPLIRTYTPSSNPGGVLPWDPSPLIPSPEILFVKLFSTTVGGGILSLRVPENLREEVNSAILYSTNINPKGSTPFVGIKHLSSTFSGNVTFEISLDNGATWSPFNCCTFYPANPPASSAIYRAILTKSGESPVLDRIQIRFEYP